MRLAIRLLILVQVLVFGAASLLHRGLLAPGFADAAAATAEGIIALVLAAGLALGLLLPRRARVLALATQAFALLGTAVGVFVLIRGVGRSTPLDVALHAVMVGLLVVGLWATWTDGREDRRAVTA